LDVNTFNMGLSDFRCVKKQVGVSCKREDGSDGTCALVHTMKILLEDLSEGHW